MDTFSISLNLHFILEESTVIDIAIKTKWLIPNKQVRLDEIECYKYKRKEWYNWDEIESNEKLGTQFLTEKCTEDKSYLKCIFIFPQYKKYLKSIT